MAWEVAAFGLGVEKFLILIGREGEVAIDFVAVEAQVEDPSRSCICDSRQRFDSTGCQSGLRSMSFEIVPTIRKIVDTVCLR